MHNYWQTGGDAAQWLSSLCGETTVSVRRDVVDPYSAPPFGTKRVGARAATTAMTSTACATPGWFSSTGAPTVVSVMAGVPDCEREIAELVENLIAAIFDARDALR